MGLFDRMWGALLGRRDEAQLALPTSPMVTQHHRRDSSVYNPMTQLGGWSDKGSVGRPSPYHLPLTPAELRTLYCYNGIARRIVDIVPQRGTRRGWVVPEIGDEDARLQTWDRICQSWTWARLHGGSPLLMVTEDDVPAGFRTRPDLWLAEPLDLQRVGKVHALQAFDAVEAAPSRWDTDIRSLGFRGPSEWQFSAPGFRARVHASRVIWMRGARRPPSELRGYGAGPMPDDGSLQVVWDEIRRLTEVLQGGAVMAQELRKAVLKLHGLSALMTSDDAGAVIERFQAMREGEGLLGVTVVDKEDDYISQSNPPTGFQELSAAGWEALAAVTGVPQVILLGSTPGGLNTDGDSSWRGFRELVSTDQETRRAEIERMYTVIYSAQDGPTGGEIPEGWTLTFAPLDEPDEASMAETRYTVAQTDEINIRNRVYTADDVRRFRYGPSGYSFELGAVEGPTVEPEPEVAPPSPAAPVPIESPNAEPAAK